MSTNQIESEFRIKGLTGFVIMVWAIAILAATYLPAVFKMADEYSKPSYNRTPGILAAYNWKSLTGLRGAELEVPYSITLRELGKECLN